MAESTGDKMKRSMAKIAPPPGGPRIGNVAAGLRPAGVAAAVKPTVVRDRFEYKVGFNYSFVGTGQGGSRIANAFYDLGYGRVAVFNTTDMDFKGLADAIPKLNLGVGGAAKDAAFAADQIKARQEEVWDLLTRAWGVTTDYAFVCASLGGGTGSGTAPQLVQIARRHLEQAGRPARVGAVVALPAAGEGQQQCRNAVAAFRELLALKVSPLVVIDNARINELYKPPVAKLYPTANTTTASLFHVFNQLAAVHSDYISFDQAELAQLLDGGVVTMGAADFDADQIQSPADISSKIRDELAGNVLAAVDLRTGRTAACVFVGHRDVLGSLSADYFDAGFNQLDRQVGSALSGTTPVVHRGLYDTGPEADAAPGLQVYTMVSGLEPPLERLAQLARAGHMESAVQSRKGLAAFLGVQD